ncbi:teichoic acid D-Ala incorporation-associated protein DltX [Pseudolactococcus raffinolactis]|uniref:teichoic acid D-Ala incorporation-associated protein DltX n=1 Tax=Pseudolactococcus raffinolactis TaxID=1366 RepID=UPI001437306A|nr:teichoic acid D-Ala incorporation-associated protein DltX [Lactococcus raffinolactis]QIW55810.1 teichoic acid D-Ala incorporation-associated protein DltX [Lactococcus raffinolactis]
MIKYIHNLPQHKAWPVIKFILQSLFYFMIIIAFLYLFNYSGKGQGHFIYNEF